MGACVCVCVHACVCVCVFGGSSRVACSACCVLWVVYCVLWFVCDGESVVEVGSVVVGGRCCMSNDR